MKVSKFILVLLLFWCSPGLALLSNVGPELSISGKIINGTFYSLNNITLEVDEYSDGNARMDYEGKGNVGQYKVDLIQGDQFLTRFYVVNNDPFKHPQKQRQCQIRVIAYDSGQVVIKSFPSSDSYIYCAIDSSGNIVLTDEKPNNQLKK